MSAAADDVRIARSDDPPLSWEEQLQIKEVKDLSASFIASLERAVRVLPSADKARCLELAKQRVQEATMWAVTGISARQS